MDAYSHLEEYIDFQKYWLVLKRRWLPATAIFVGTVTFSVGYSLSLDPIYKAEAKLLIKTDRTAKIIGFENGTGDIAGLTSDSNPLATEAEILQSRPIINNLIQELELKNDGGKYLEYENVVGPLNVKPIGGTDVLEVSYTHTDQELAAAVVNKVIEIYKQDDAISNRSETAAARKFIADQLPQVEANLKRAEADLREFQNQNRIADLNQETSATIASINATESQINQVKADLNDIDARYSTLSNQLNMSWQEASTISSLSQSLAVQRVLEQLQEVKVALAEKGSYLSDKHPEILDLKDEEADLTALLDQQIAKTLGSQQQELVRKVNILSLGELKRAQIAEFANLGLQKEGLEQKLETLNNTYDSYQQRSEALPALQKQLRELERRVEAAQSTYQNFLSRLQETQIAEQQNIGNVRVVSEAVVPDEPVGPAKKPIVAAAGIVGALLGIAVAFLLDIWDKSIKNLQEIEKMLPYPLCGIIPDYNKVHNQTTAKKQLFLPDSSTANLPKLAVANISVLPIREAYHNIQVSLKMLDDPASNKVIAVTSSVSGEGKSSVAANLAIAEAQCGQKVLLVDGDLRRPTQHLLWELPNQVGLTNVLNQEVGWYDILYQAMPNLDVMTSGTISKHPISLLNSPSIAALIASATTYYDRIIFDTPPLVGLADTKILGKLVDGILFVVRPGMTQYGSIAAAKKSLAARDIKVLGVVANGVNLKKESHSYRYDCPDKKYIEETEPQSDYLEESN